jgi:hypothetical protein
VAAAAVVAAAGILQEVAFQETVVLAEVVAQAASLFTGFLEMQALQGQPDSKVQQADPRVQQDSKGRQGLRVPGR